MFLGEDLVEDGCTIQVKAMGVEGLVQCTTLGFLDLLWRNPTPSRMFPPPMEMWTIPASSLHWVAMRVGQLMTQWSLLPQLKQFIFPDALASIFTEAHQK